MAEPPIGIIAAGGRLPVLSALGVRAAGREVACVGLAGQYDPQMPALSRRFGRSGVVRVGRWVRLLRRWGVREAVLVGKVRKERMYDPLRLFRQWPDFKAAKLWYRVRHDKRTDAMLTVLSDELLACGITLIDTTRYIPDHLAHQGVMTRVQPSSALQGDITFGLPIAQGVAGLDVGQAIAVKEREVIAVEAMEGTDAMIRRAGELCRSGGWLLIKIAKPQQDLRFDVPTIGLDTIRNVKAAGGRCIAVQAGKTIMLDKPQLIAEADRLGVALVGLTVDKAPL